MSPTELNARLDAYLALRQALGFTMRAECTLLRDFVRFLEAKGGLNPIRAQVALDWACSSSLSRGGSGQAARLSMVRGFLHHLRAAYPDTEVPDVGLVVGSRRPTPYLFSAEEIDKLLAVAQQAGPRGSLRPYTLATLINLLSSTGLRVGEAMRLNVPDLRLDDHPPHLIIRETKFRKSRLVPLHATTAEMLRRYAGQRKEMGYDSLSEVFLVSEKGTPLRVSTIGHWFSKQVLQLGLWPQKGKRWPCLQCFRHTFAVRRLQTWYQEGADVQAMVPHLSVYLGHLRPQESYWYLTATPQLLGTAAERFRQYAPEGDQQ
jgi:integrase/recombinase XerD